MLSGEPYQQSASEQMTTNEESQSVPQTLYFLPFAVQLQNIFPIEITARRFPVEIANAPSAQLSISEIQIDAENRHAQAILEIQVSFSEEPRPFEISCKMMGQFAYAEANKETNPQEM